MWTVQPRFLGFTLVAGVICLSCSGDRAPVDPVENVVRVSGTIRSWVCRNGFNPQPSLDRLYVRDWRGSAELTFVDSLGRQDSCFADDSSEYKIELTPGRYDLVLETDHNYPETLFAVAVAKDTVLDWEIDVWWYDGDSLTFRIVYDLVSDSLGETAERAYLMFLNDRIGNMLEIESARRAVYWPDHDPNSYSPGYAMAVRPGFRIWQVIEAANDVLDEYGSFFPEHTSLYAHGVLCLW